MVAGFVTGYLNTGDYEKAFELGIATGSASAFEYWLAEKEDVVKLLKKEPRKHYSPYLRGKCFLSLSG